MRALARNELQLHFNNQKEAFAGYYCITKYLHHNSKCRLLAYLKEGHPIIKLLMT